MATTALPPVRVSPPGRTGPPALTVAGLALAAVLLLAATVAAGAKGALAGAVVLDGALIAFATHKVLLRWHSLAVTVILCILLIPIGRYDFPVTLPFNMEPYRALVMVVALIWGASLLAQPDTRWRRTGLFMPLFLLSVSVVIGIGLNTDRLALPGVQSAVIKQVSMFASFIFVLLFFSAVIATRDHLNLVIKSLVGGGAVVSFFAIIQYHTGFNIFDHLDRGIPVLRLVPGGVPDHIEARGSGARIYASAPHPIALSAALVMLLPLGIYLGKAFGGKRWWICTAMIGVAAFATVARTGSVMLLVIFFTYLALKPRQVLSLWPWLLPFLVAVHFLAPGAIGGLKSAFFPSGGIVAEQETQAGMTSSNRLADWGPTIAEWSKKPVFGEGFGTRITAPADPNLNAAILDDQWLASLLETGLAGVIAILWLICSTVRRTASASRKAEEPYSWLLIGLAGSVASFAVGALTFDAFSFFQCTFLMFALMGIAIPARRLCKRPVATHSVALVR